VNSFLGASSSFAPLDTDSEDITILQSVGNYSDTSANEDNSFRDHIR